MTFLSLSGKPEERSPCRASCRLETRGVRDNTKQEQEEFVFPATPRHSLGPTQLPVMWDTRTTLLSRLKQPVHAVGHLHSSCVEVKNARSCIIKHKDNFTFSIFLLEWLFETISCHFWISRSGTFSLEAVTLSCLWACFPCTRALCTMMYFQSHWMYLDPTGMSITMSQQLCQIRICS
jgi:hypothetical protein